MKLGEVPSSSKHQIFSSREGSSFPGEAAGQAVHPVLLSDVIPGLSILRLGMGPDLTHTAGGSTRRSRARPARTTYGYSQFDWHHVRLTDYQADAGLVSKPWPATPGIARSTTPRRQGDGGKRCASLNGISLASHLPPCAPCKLRARYWLGQYVGPSYLRYLKCTIIDFARTAISNLRGGR